MKIKHLLLALVLLNVGCSSKVEKQPTLTIYTQPDKTEYDCGNDFDKTGLKLKYVDENGVEEIVEDFEVVDGNNLTYSMSSVQCSYKGKNVYVPIEMSDVFAGQITLIGDSLTQGHYWPTEAYPNYIKDYFEDSSKITISNCGKDGASFNNLGIYNPAYNTTTQYETSKTGNPRVITIFLGTNDSINWDLEGPRFYDDLSGLINEYLTLFKDAKIILLSTPRCVNGNDWDIKKEVILEEINPIKEQIAEELEISYIDVNEALDEYTDAQLFRDKVHLTVQAAKIVAELIAEEIKILYELD